MMVGPFYSKTCVKRPLSKRPKIGFQDLDYHLMQVKSIAEFYHFKTCVKRPLSKRPKIGFQDQLSLNASRKYYRMLEGEHSAILLTFIKLPFFIKIVVLIFGWPVLHRFSCTS